MATTKTTASTPVEPSAETPAIEAPVASTPVAAPIANTPILGVTSLVTAIVSIALAQPLLAIVAIALGFVGRTREPANVTTANWGIALGFISLFGGLILVTLGIIAFVPLALSSAIWGW
ncbi:hypothetical protein BH11ACT3_BH11ACT3_09470 [soil metagenome]